MPLSSPSLYPPRENEPASDFRRLVFDPIESRVRQTAPHFTKRVTFSLGNLHQQRRVFRDMQRSGLFRVDERIMHDEQAARRKRCVRFREQVAHCGLLPVVQDIRDEMHIEAAGPFVHTNQEFKT